MGSLCDFQSSLLTLGRAQVNLVLLSLNRSLDFQGLQPHPSMEHAPPDDGIRSGGLPPVRGQPPGSSDATSETSVNVIVIITRLADSGLCRMARCSVWHRSAGTLYSYVCKKDGIMCLFLQFFARFFGFLDNNFYLCSQQIVLIP